jgi:hypothetical protein
MKSLFVLDCLAILYQLCRAIPLRRTRHKGDLMKKQSKKLKLAKETLLNLEAGSMENVLGAIETERSVCKTICATNCQFTACGTACPGCA